MLEQPGKRNVPSRQFTGSVIFAAEMSLDIRESAVRMSALLSECRQGKKEPGCGLGTQNRPEWFRMNKLGTFLEKRLC